MVLLTDQILTDCKNKDTVIPVVHNTNGVTVRQKIPLPQRPTNFQPVNNPVNNTIPQTNRSPVRQPVSQLPQPQPQSERNGESIPQRIWNPNLQPDRQPQREMQPWSQPDRQPTRNPVRNPDQQPVRNPVNNPVNNPVRNPDLQSTRNPVRNPDQQPTRNPTTTPNRNPVGDSVSNPSQSDQQQVRNPTREIRAAAELERQRQRQRERTRQLQEEAQRNRQAEKPKPVVDAETEKLRFPGESDQELLQRLERQKAARQAEADVAKSRNIGRQGQKGIQGVGETLRGDGNGIINGDLLPPRNFDRPPLRIPFGTVLKEAADKIFNSPLLDILGELVFAEPFGNLEDRFLPGELADYDRKKRDRIKDQSLPQNGTPVLAPPGKVLRVRGRSPNNGGVVLTDYFYAFTLIFERVYWGYLITYSRSIDPPNQVLFHHWVSLSGVTQQLGINGGSAVFDYYTLQIDLVDLPRPSWSDLPGWEWPDDYPEPGLLYQAPDGSPVEVDPGRVDRGAAPPPTGPRTRTRPPRWRNPGGDWFPFTAPNTPATATGPQPLDPNNPAYYGAPSLGALDTAPRWANGQFRTGGFESPQEMEDCSMTCRFSLEAIRRMMNRELKQTVTIPVYNPILGVPLPQTFDILSIADTTQAQATLLQAVLNPPLGIPNRWDEVLDAIANLQGGHGINYVDIDVPIAEYLPDGTVEVTPQTVTVPEAESAQIQALFFQVATVKEWLSKVERYSERVHNLLGGKNYFRWGEGGVIDDDPESREPRFSQINLSRRAQIDLVTLYNRNDQGQIIVDPESGWLSEPEATGYDLIDLLYRMQLPFYWKLGAGDVPQTYPRSLINGDTQEVEIRTVFEMMDWQTQQLDALLGLFPVEIEIEDSNPLTPGKQVKRIQLANLSEALAELYGLAISGTTNADVAISFLMRLSAEMIATKNATLITQDYAKANASFLGYKGNPKKREIDYAFNPAKLGSLEELLKESKGFIEGWEETDKESVVGFLQKIVFASGITKAAFFRNKDRLGILKKELEALTQKGDALENQDWQKFLDLINNPNSPFNRGENPEPQIKTRLRNDGTLATDDTPTNQP